MTQSPSPIVDEVADGNAPLPFDRDQLGRFVREAWVRWAATQTSPKPSWLVAYDDLSEADKEADRQIGEAISRWTITGMAARASLVSPPKAGAGEPVGFINAQGGFLLTEAGAEWFKAAMANAGPAPVGVAALPLYANHEARGDGVRVTDGMVDAALHAAVPGGAEVSAWLPTGTDKADRTARAIIRAALEAALPPLGDGRAEIVEECARLCDAEAELRFAQARKADAGDTSWGIDTHAASMAQDNKAITARHLAAAIRSLSNPGGSE